MLHSRQFGFALVIVLGFLVLLTVLVIAFFSSVTTDYASTKQYSSETTTRQLADSVVQLVMGQIKAGTSVTDQTWASQPGMIRSYDTAGNPVTNYKLYSSNAMTSAGVLTLPQISEFDMAWNSKPAAWTDLNAPVIDAVGTADFPIVDGNNIKLLTQDAAGNSIAPYLGYDAVNNATGVAGQDGLPDVDGFAVDPSTVSFDPSQKPSLTNTAVPLPVRWLYQLRDGTLLAPDVGGATSAAFVASATKPTSANPIVGRLAFWTDDETSKVNVNTAAEGTYWDTPRFQTANPAVNTIVPGGVVNQSAALSYPDYSFACFPPAQFEFQRYPGHPAQVALSTVFPGMTTLNAIGVTPRIAAGGSQGGTVYPGTSATINLSTAPKKAPYASVDEYLYSGDTSNSTRTVNNLPAAANKTLLEQAKFFITANCRAPEVNLFNQPRIACWPIDSSLTGSNNSPRTTVYDRLIAYCATLRHDLGPAAYPYYFQRSNSQSPTYDYAQIARNQLLYQYLQRLTGRPTPGFGGNFLAKYPLDRDQILTEIFDYIRCTNLDDPGLGGYPISTSAAPGGSWPTTTNQFAVAKKTPSNGTNTSLLGLGQVMPIQINSTMGFGRFACVKEVAFVFVCTADADVAASNNPLTNPTLNGVALAAGQCRVQMMVLYRLHSPAAGLVGLHPDMIIEMANLENVRVANAVNIPTGGPSLFPSSPTSAGWLEKISANELRNYNVPLYFDSLVQPNWRSAINTTDTPPQNAYPYYPFISQPFTVKKTDGIQFSILPYPIDATANLILKLYQGKNAYDYANRRLSANFIEAIAPNLTTVTADTTTNLYQTANFFFPATTFVTPTFSTAAPPASGSAFSVTTTSRIEDRLPFGYAGSNGAGLVLAGDTIGAMYYNGDARLAALQRNIPVSRFSAYPGYGTSSAKHQLASGIAGFTAYPIGGNGSQTFSSQYVPPNTSATLGDYELISRTDLGAMINKPDEGDSSNLANGGGAPPYYFFDQRTEYANLYTPNRVMPSPGMFGSLPTGAKAGNGWQTLLFRPQLGHPGALSPPDHLIMDLFWMPVVEPYAISEPMSTGGKVNMNYQLAPFTYLKRSTALKAAMKIEMGCAIPNATSNAFPIDSNNGSNAWRKTLNLSDSNGSLRGFREKFDGGDLFRSASQICDIYLTPRGQAWASDSAASAFWTNNSNTPENVREKPYANLYARLTTKSNTYSVHFRVQALQKVPSTDVAQWIEAKDKVTSEYRGSSIIERYVDADDSNLTDFADPANANTSINSFYKFRVVSTKKFAP